MCKLYVTQIFNVLNKILLKYASAMFYRPTNNAITPSPHRKQPKNCVAMAHILSI